MERDLSTETKIKEAAIRIFTAKGFNGCTSREIAKEAGINVALLNYYFKSKGQLFDIVIASVLNDFTFSLIDVLKSNIKQQTKDLSVDWNSAKLDLSSKTLEVNLGDLELINLSLIWDDISEDNLIKRFNDLKKKNESDGFTVLRKNPIRYDKYWFLLIAISK